MAQTRDGIQTPYPPNPVGLGLGVVLAGGAVAALVMDTSSWCFAVPALLVGGLMIANQFGGITRVRVTHSKLLVEDERLVMGFLVGPSKRRIAWTDYASAEVAGDEVVVKGKSGTELRVGKGQPADDLNALVRRIGEAEQNFREEGG
ncbi:MAG: hypothetical protein AAF211_14640 [Myxococcota bacterium]